MSKKAFFHLSAIYDDANDRDFGPGMHQQLSLEIEGNQMELHFLFYSLLASDEYARNIILNAAAHFLDRGGVDTKIMGMTDKSKPRTDKPSEQ